MAGLTRARPRAPDDAVEAFDCGRPSMNAWFRRHAKPNQEAGISRTTVFTDGESGGIVGYVTLAAGQIEREHLPNAARRNRPDAVPVILLGQLAVDRRFQGKGLARQLLLHALGTCLALSKEIGCFGVIAHPLDDEVRAFWRRFGFADLPGDPRRAMIVRIKDLEASGFGGEVASAAEVPFVLRDAR